MGLFKTTPRVPGSLGMNLRTGGVQGEEGTPQDPHLQMGQVGLRLAIPALLERAVEIP